MPFDSELTILEGLSALKETFVPSIVTTWGMAEVKETGAKGLAAVMVAPRINVTYLNYMTGHIEESDVPAVGWEQVASFPTLHQYMRRIYCIATAVAVEADIGKYLYGATTTDDGKIISIDKELAVVGGKGYVYFSMVDSGDTFDNASETLTTNTAVGGGGSGTFAGTSLAISTPVEPGGIRVVRFATKKRYIRFNATLNGNFQAVYVGLVPWPFDTL